jgi:hypothetical protein
MYYTVSSREGVGDTAALYLYYSMIEVPLLCTVSGSSLLGIELTGRELSSSLCAADFSSRSP